MSDLLGRLEEAVEHYNLLRHPFYEKWSEGTLTLEELQIYAKQYFHFTREIPTYVSRVHSNCPDPALRISILSNLVDEETGGEGMVPHEELWVWFGEGIGLKKSDLYQDEPAATTLNTLDTYRRLCSSSNCAIGAAALYAYESRIPAVAETKLAGLKRFYQIDNENTLRFFREHMAVDIEHSKTWQEVLAKIVETEEQKESVIDACSTAAQSLWGMLDGVLALCKTDFSCRS